MVFNKLNCLKPVDRNRIISLIIKSTINMQITICDICNKKVEGNGLRISASGLLKNEADSSFEFYDKNVCSGCYVKFKSQFLKILSPLKIPKAKTIK